MKEKTMHQPLSWRLSTHVYRRCFVKNKRSDQLEIPFFWWRHDFYLKGNNLSPYVCFAILVVISEESSTAGSFRMDTFGAQICNSHLWYAGCVITVKVYCINELLRANLRKSGYKRRKRQEPIRAKYARHHWARKKNKSMKKHHAWINHHWLSQCKVHKRTT